MFFFLLKEWKMFGFSEITRPQKRHFLQPESGCLQAAATVRPQKQRPCRLPGDFSTDSPIEKGDSYEIPLPASGHERAAFGRCARSAAGTSPRSWHHHAKRTVGCSVGADRPEPDLPRLANPPHLLEISKPRGRRFAAGVFGTFRPEN